jgi:hypothetical protein
MGDKPPPEEEEEESASATDEEAGRIGVTGASLTDGTDGTRTADGEMGKEKEKEKQEL